MSLKDCVDRVRYIYSECAVEAREQLANERALDDYTRFKKKIHQSVKDARKFLKERDAVLNSSGGTAADAAKLSHQCRMCIKAAKEDLVALEEVQRKSEKKELKKKRPEEIARNAARKEVVALCHQHIEELENAEKRRGQDSITAERHTLFAGGSGAVRGLGSSRVADVPRAGNAINASPSARGGFDTSAEHGFGVGRERKELLRTASPAGGGVGVGRVGGAGTETAPPPYETELPDIDVAEDLLMLQQQGVNIDRELEDISAGIGTLKALAQDMNQEIEKQNAMLDEVEEKAEKADEHMKSVNTKMKNTLDGLMKGDRFMVNCILLTILLALVGFIASYLTT